MFKRTKYGARKTVVDGIEFASKKEAKRYGELKLLERAGEIRELELQPRFTLQEGFRDFSGKAVRDIEYVGDFQYIEINCKRPWVFSQNGNERMIVEDVKGMRTDVYKLKRKLFLKRYPHIEHREV